MSLPGEHEVTVRTERLLLRSMRMEDANDIFALRSNPKVFYWTTPEAELWQTEEWIQKRLNNPLSFNFSIELLPTAVTEATEHNNQKSSNHKFAKVIGLCGGHSLPEIGYIFDPSLWGWGYATEALTAFLKVYWETWPKGHSLLEGDETKYLKAITGKDGHASMAVLKKCGFEFWREEVEEDEGNGRESVWAWRGWRPGFVTEK